MKKVLTVLLVLILVAPLFAERSVVLQDVGIRLGHASFTSEKGKMNVMAGVTIGLSERMEFNPEIIVPLTPVFLEKCNLGCEVGISLLGNRVHSTDVTGSTLNTVLSFGFFTENLKPRYVTLRITPVTIGAPFSGRRESLFPVGIAWDMKEEKVCCFFSIAVYDHYLRGTWAQLRGE